MGPATTAPLPPDWATQLADQQLALHARQLPTAILGTAVAAATLAGLVAGHAAPGALQLWISLITGVTLARYALLRRYRTRPTSALRPWFLGGAAAAGTCWGLAGWLFVSSTQPHEWIATVFVLAGMTGAGVATLSPLPRAFLCFALPALAPLVFRFTLLDAPGSGALALLTGIYAALMFAAGRELERTHAHALKQALRAQHAAAALEHTSAELAHEGSLRAATAVAMAEMGGQLQATFDNPSIHVAYLDRELRFLKVNAAYARDAGHAPDFFTGQRYADVFPDPAAEAVLLRVLQTGIPHIETSHLFAHSDPGAARTWWDWSVAPVRGADRTIQGLLITLVDVTRAERAQQDLQRADHKLRLLLDGIADPVLLADATGRILIANSAGARHMGTSGEQLIGTALARIFPDTDMERHVRSALVQREPQQFEALARPGKRCRVRLFPVNDDQGRVTHVALFATDVTNESLELATDRLLHEVDRAMLRGDGLEELLRLICNETCRIHGFPLAWVGRKGVGGLVEILAGGGPMVSYLDEMRRVGVRWDDSPTGNGTTGSAIRTGETQLLRASDARFWPWRQAAERFGFQSIVALPLVLRGEVLGALTLYAPGTAPLDDGNIVRRLTELTSRIAVTIERSQDQTRLRLLSAALASAGNGIFITNRDGRIEWANDAFSRLSGFANDEIIGQSPRFLKSGRHEPDYYRKLWDTILGGKLFTAETTERHKDGHLYTVIQTITPIVDGTGAITHFVSIHEDITPQKLATERIEYLAHHDALTGLPNRTLLLDRLRQALARAQRQANQVALLFIDLDGFKAVNDAHGHRAGDAVLKEIAARLRTIGRASDTVARLAGDEFTMILPDLEQPEHAQRVADRVVQLLAEPITIDESGQTVQVGASVGIALYPGDGGDIDALLHAADAAMYQAKQGGGARAIRHVA